MADKLEELISAIRTYYPDANLDTVSKAYRFAKSKHEGQVRKSGEPYYIHPLEVAITLTKMKMDIPSIVASLLHDVVEDTDAGIEEIKQSFGLEIAQLVDGVTKLSKFNFKSTEEAQAENFRKMIIAMAKDIRVIIVKLADRYHNMMTLQHLHDDKKIRIAQETIDIYAPLANRLGISWLKTELEDLALKYLNPDMYLLLSDKVKKNKEDREKYIKEVISIIQDRLAEYHMKAQVTGRPKHFYSIAKKMEMRHLEFEQIFDVIAFRILVDDVSQCYEALGIIHSFWKPVPGRFKDYIAMPKANNYQSLHTTVIGPYGERVEIQIRTNEMNQVSEYGIAAHWRYKEGHIAEDDVKKFTWLRSLLENQQEISDPNEFMDSVKLDLFSGEVYVFTPKGEVKELPEGSTPIDLAYSIHSDIGNRCVGAKVNGKIVPLKFRLRSGDTVEIIASPNQSPKKDWLKYAKTSKAKNKIRHFIKTNEKERSKELGMDMLEKELKRVGSSIQNLKKEGRLSEITSDLKYKSADDLFIGIGYGKHTPKEIVKLLIPDLEESKDPEKLSIIQEIIQKATKTVRSSKTSVRVKGVDDILVRYARCCTPLPGEPIIGFITRGRGITIHAKTCSKIPEIAQERLIEVEWDSEVKQSRTIRIRLITLDEQGLFAKITKTLSENGADIVTANMRTTRDRKSLSFFEIKLHDMDQLTKILKTLKDLDSVVSAERVSMQGQDKK